MLYITWSLLNIGLFLFFIYTCIRATRTIREQLGIFAAIIFVFGLLSFFAAPDDDRESGEAKSNELKKWEFNPANKITANTTDFIIITLENTSISKHKLGIQYGLEQETYKLTPIYANSWREGFSSGTSWKPINILVTPDETNHQLNYDVDGTITWKLLGATIYIQLKEYTGVVDLK